MAETGCSYGSIHCGSVRMHVPYDKQEISDICQLAVPDVDSGCNRSFLCTAVFNTFGWMHEPVIGYRPQPDQVCFVRTQSWLDLPLHLRGLSDTRIAVGHTILRLRVSPVPSIQKATIVTESHQYLKNF